MRTKVEWASAIALVATVLTTVVSTKGSVAAASDNDPVVTRQVTASEHDDSQQAAVQFIAQPVVQPIEDEAEDEPASLSELVSRQTMPEQISSEMRCLAGGIYFESRGESLEGQLAVGRVIINRARSGRFPDSYCGVIFQPSQFSFVRGSKMPHIREHSKNWRRAVAIAQIALDDSWKNPAKGALFFHATRVTPNWQLTRLARVDNHIFYR